MAQAGKGKLNFRCPSCFMRDLDIDMFYDKEKDEFYCLRCQYRGNEKDVLEKIDESKVDKNFLQFAEFVRDDVNYATEESFVNEGEPWKDLFSKAWAGDITLDEAIEIHEKNATKGLRKAIQDGKYDVERQKRVYKYIQGDDSQDVAFKNW